MTKINVEGIPVIADIIKTGKSFESTIWANGSDNSVYKKKVKRCILPGKAHVKLENHMYYICMCDPDTHAEDYAQLAGVFARNGYSEDWILDLVDAIEAI